MTHLAMSILLLFVTLEQIHPAAEKEHQVIDIPLYDIIDINSSGTIHSLGKALKATFSNRWHWVLHYYGCS